MALLPIFTNTDSTFQMMQQKWASQLNPLLSNQSLQSSILAKVMLQTGQNTINHNLGKNLTGWRIIRKRAAADIYDAQDGNPRPNLTLILQATAPVLVDIEVF